MLGQQYLYLQYNLQNQICSDMQIDEIKKNEDETTRRAYNYYNGQMPSGGTHKLCTKTNDNALSNYYPDYVVM